MVGVAYKVPITPKFGVFPRLGFGPLVVTNPSLNAIVSSGNDTNNLDRKSETGVGVGYEVGFGLRKDLGKRFSLMLTFTLAGGLVKIADEKLIIIMFLKSMIIALESNLSTTEYPLHIDFISFH